MLEIKNITKEYPAGNGKVNALRGVSLQFRSSEFVSILGPSGCGKTTLLNIVGGLDQYTAGDLVINGTSTRDYKDRDWDAYRNHSVGFVFQSYHLIPHQSVLRNVELALTLSGVSRQERRQRAKAALERVGLGDQTDKRPNQLSGGQMQRVAIARALVNDPEIILADEPTGALDTETSIQVMDLLREIAKDRLVIMVTHNPELAQQYSTRIVRMLDGQILNDSNPLTEAELEQETAKGRKAREARLAAGRKDKKPSMSLFTSFGLSLRNLISKKGRTALTSFAGSIGIIGIALIYAVSQGMTTYIDMIQEETLSSYPLTIQAESMDLGSLMLTFMDQAHSDQQHDRDAVYQKGMIYALLNAMNNTETTKNDLASFKSHLEQSMGDPESLLAQNIGGVQYSYDLSLQIFTETVDGTVRTADSEALMQELMMKYLRVDTSSLTALRETGSMAGMGAMSSSQVRLFQELLPGRDGQPVNPLLEKQYDVIHGRWPAAYNEVVLVVDRNNELDDMTLYALGLKSEAEIEELANAALRGGTLELPEQRWSYEDICGMQFRVVLNGNCYTPDALSGTYTDLRDSQAGLRYLYDNGLELKVCGIIRPAEDSMSTILTGAIGYTSALTDHLLEQGKTPAAVQAQLKAPDTDVFTGLPFRSGNGTMGDAEKAAIFRDQVAAMDTARQAEAYISVMSIPSDEQLAGMVQQALAGQTRETMEAAMTQAIGQQTGMDAASVAEYLKAMSDEELTGFFSQLAAQQAQAQYAAQVRARLAGMSEEQLAGALQMALPGYTEAQCAKYHDQVLSFSDANLETNLKKLGCLDAASPSAINLYATSFDGKDRIEEAIAAYNSGVEELQQIRYTDYVGLMMQSVTTIINAITYVLISFVAVSLVVSSIMIGVITLISVQERTKEIGILRAIGASRRNVSNMFNAETVIIGFTSGLLGVLLTKLLCIPINAILHHVTGIGNLNAYLPWPVAGLLVAISMLLTLFAGVIPSRSAAKNDPVQALRSE